MGCTTRLPSRSSGCCCSAQFWTRLFIQGIACYFYVSPSAKRIQYNEKKVTFSFVWASVSCCLQAFRFHICFPFFVYSRSKHPLIDCDVRLLTSVDLCQFLSGEDYPKSLQFSLLVLEVNELQRIKE